MNDIIRIDSSDNEQPPAVRSIQLDPETGASFAVFLKRYRGRPGAVGSHLMELVLHLASAILDTQETSSRLFPWLESYIVNLATYIRAEASPSEEVPAAELAKQIPGPTRPKPKAYGHGWQIPYEMASIIEYQARLEGVSESEIIEKSLDLYLDAIAKTPRPERVIPGPWEGTSRLSIPREMPGDEPMTPSVPVVTDGELPRIANRSDALEALDELIEEADMDGTRRRVRILMALKSAIERGLF